MSSTLDTTSKHERINKRKGMTISLIIHALVLLIFFLKFLDAPINLDDKFAIQVQFDEPIIVEEPIFEEDGGTTGPEDESADEGGSEAAEAEPPLEQVIEEMEQIESQKPVEVEVPKPEEVPAPKPVITTPDPEPVVVPEVQQKPETSKPDVDKSDPAPTTTQDQSKKIPDIKVPAPTKGPTGGATGTGGTGSMGDSDLGGTGGSGSGSGSGSGPGRSNSGTGLGGGGSGSGIGSGGTFDGTGPLRRQPVSRPDLKKLARPGREKIVFNMCIDREGNVTYVRFNTRMSQSRDVNYIKKVTQAMMQYKFQKKSDAPRKECGTFTFITPG